MARKKVTKKPKYSKDVEKEPKLARGVGQEIVAILIMILAVVLLLSSFGWGGDLANQVFATLRLSLGFAAFDGKTCGLHRSWVRYAA